MTAAIETFGLTKKYDGVAAVSDLDLRVEAGQAFGFLGPNGAGKSTTIRMLMALQRPTRGRASLLGLDAGAQSVEVHRRTGYLPGDLELFPRLTGRSTSTGSPAAAAASMTPSSGTCWSASSSSPTGRSASCPRATGRRSGWSWPSCTNRSC